MAHIGFEPSLPARHVSRRQLLRGFAAGGMGLAAAALIGCGASDDDGGAGGTTSSPATTGGGQAVPTQLAAGGTGVRVAGAPTPVSGLELPDEFIVATEGEPAGLDPYNAFTGYSGWGQMIARAMYQTMFELRITLDEAGNPQREWAPMLVESFERPDPERWLLRMRPGVTFHNGESWDAEAAVASYEWFTDEAILESLNRTNRFSQVASFEAIDANTVEMVTTTPNSEIWERFRTGFSALPPTVLESNWESLGEQPIGTGPFKLREFARGTHITLGQYPEYWGASSPVPYVGLPNYQRIKFLPRPEATVRTLQIETNESHMAFNIGAANAVPRLQHWAAGGGFQTSMVRMNNVVAPMDDIRLRQAINYAIDRQTIADQVFLGTAKPVAFFGFHPVEVEPYPYNPDEARKLVAAAGLEGHELEMVWGEFRIPEEEQLAELYVGYLADIGLNLRLNRQDAIAYNDIGGRPWPEQPPLFLETTSSGNSGVVSGLDDKFGCEGSGTYCNPSIEEAWQPLRNLEGEEFNTLLSQVANDLREDASRAFVVAVQLVHGLAPFVDATRLPRNTYIRVDELPFAV
ncbi:MAG: hypothetical protein GEU80_07560 [Dehalococcoidia bacterium]|nr:hypothetical protein [Dehalococcoidia bacterium]